VTPQILWAIPIVAMLILVGAGIAMLLATVQVYFRDLTNFLPYAMRIWLYASPVLYFAAQVPPKFKPILAANPLYPLLTSLSDAVNLGREPRPMLLLWGLGWAVGLFVIGALFFVSREREFAVRL
jgi:teichoic acid transport system permease protein